MNRVVLFVLMSAAGCASAPDYTKLTARPQVELRAIDIDDPSLTAATLVMDLEIRNPNPVDVDLDRLSYSLRLNGNDVAQGELEKSIDLDAGDSARIQVPVRFHYSDVFDSLDELARVGSTAYEFKGSITTGPLEIPFKYDGKVTLPKPGAGAGP